MPYLPESLLQRLQDGEAPIGFETGLAQMVLNESVSDLPNAASDPLELFRLWKQISRFEKDYRDLMEGSIKQLFEIDERMFDLSRMNPGGISEVDYSTLPAKINAEALCLPVLIQEMAKGLLEVTALWGLPGALDDESVPPLIHKYHLDLRKEVLAQADKLEYEIWDQRLGMGLHTLEFASPFSLENFRQFCLCPAKELVERLSP